jgi:hypothetical protein
LAAQKVATKTEEKLDDLKRDSAEKEATATPTLAEARPPSMPLETSKAREQLSNLSVSPTRVTEAVAPASAQQNGFTRRLVPATASPLASAASDAGLTGIEKKQAVGTAPPQFSALPDQATTQPVPAQFSPPPVSPASNSLISPVVQYGYFAGTQVGGGPPRSFQQVNRGTDYSLKAGVPVGPASAQVLTYFRVEQSGPELRVIDSDDSVYAGHVNLSFPPSAISAVDVQHPKAAQSFRAASTQTEATKAAALVPTQQQVSAPEYSFQVVGTNRTLRQRVVFSGLIKSSAESGGSVTAQSEALGGAIQASDALRRLPQGNLRVSGTALIGPEQVNIEALPAQGPATTR